jgi:hypothetical protein
MWRRRNLRLLGCSLRAKISCRFPAPSDDGEPQCLSGEVNRVIAPCARTTGRRCRDRNSARQFSEARIHGAYRLHLAAALSVQLRLGAELYRHGRRPAGCRRARAAPCARIAGTHQSLGRRHADGPRHVGRQADMQRSGANPIAATRRPAILSLLREVQRIPEHLAATPGAKCL